MLTFLLLSCFLVSYLVFFNLVLKPFRQTRQDVSEFFHKKNVSNQPEV